MPEQLQSNAASLGNIRWTSTHVHELQDGRAVISVDTASLHHAVIRYGFSAQRPIPQLIVGALISAVAIPFIILAIGGIVRHLTLFAIPTFLLGLYVAYDALRRTYILDLYFPHGRRKLAFGKNITRDQLPAFCDAVQQITQTPIDIVAA